ncbi:MAG: ABC transporter ATP-binding protein [Pyrinomonadaceae bacterium]
MLGVKNISISYGSCEVLLDISLTLAPGRIVVLLGANGAGKTTLIKSLNGTLPVSFGEITLGGASIVKISRREIAKSIAVVAQENETRFPVTVLEFVLSGRFIHGGRFWMGNGSGY